MNIFLLSQLVTYVLLILSSSGCLFMVVRKRKVEGTVGVSMMAVTGVLMILAVAFAVTEAAFNFTGDYFQ